jgi:ABC-type bacteriocin/lantibiotic exporter with double-glycine peptidase domain
MPYLSELIYVLTLSFRRYKGLYVVYFANIISILIEFLAIAILSMVSQKGVELRFYFLQGISKEVLFIIFIALFLLRFISMLILEGFIVYFAKEMQVYFSSSAFRKVLFENIKDIEKVEIGHYITLSGDEASNASQLLISTSAIINSLLLIAAYLIAVMMFANNILIWLLVLFLLIAVLVKIIYKKLFYLGHKQANLRRSSSSIFMDAFNSLRVIKAFSLEKYMSQKYKEEVDKYFGINSLLEIYGNLTKIIPIILLFLFFEFYLVTNYIYHDIFNITFLVTLLFMMMRLLQSIGTLSGLLGKIAGQLKGVKNLVEFIQKSYISSQKSNLESSIKRLDIENITFAYGENKIFNGLNLSFISGKSYAICGESGSGKSTLLDLMLNFITPQEGKITVNGIDVQHIEENNLTKHILYIGQESLI